MMYFSLNTIIICMHYLIFYSCLRHGVSWGSGQAGGEGEPEGAEAEQSCGELHLEHHCTEGSCSPLFLHSLILLISSDKMPLRLFALCYSYSLSTFFSLLFLVKSFSILESQCLSFMKQMRPPPPYSRVSAICYAVLKWMHWMLCGSWC